MPKERRNRLRPLVLEAVGQLSTLFRLRLVDQARLRVISSPHLRLVGLGDCIHGDQPVVANFGEAQPSHVPASVAERIVEDALLGIRQDIAAEGIVGSETAKLSQKLIRIHIVQPRRRHGFLESPRIRLVIASCRNLLDAAKFSEGVNAMCG